MSYNDLFNQRRKNGHYDNHGYYGGHGDGHYGNHGDIERYRYLFEKLKSSKKLLIALAVVAIVVTLIVIAVIAMFIPLIFKLIGTVQTGGISGIIDTAKPLLERLWSGTGK